jgi:DNA-binding transcriptional LysR family regulator
MTIDHFRFFLALTKSLNFSTTADDLCISQSSLSKYIKSLEDECKVRLFDRNTRHIKLTDAGIMMKMHVERLLDNYNEMLSAIEKYSGHRQKTFTLYAIPVLPSYGIIEMFTQFTRKNPNINCNIQEMDAEFVLKAFAMNKADIILMRPYNLDQSGLKIFPIIDDELVLVTNRNHRFAKHEIISLHEAASEQFYLLGKCTYLYQVCINECLKCGFYPRHEHSELRLNTILSFIKQGSGVSMLMKKVADRRVDDEISIVRLKERPVLPLALITRDKEISDICLRFIDFAGSYFSESELVNIVQASS